MELQGRDLTRNLKGEDVALLHKELIQLGYKIASDELKDKAFGKTTLDAVVDLQKQSNLKQTGIVDSQTAAVMQRNTGGDTDPKKEDGDKPADKTGDTKSGSDKGGGNDNGGHGDEKFRITGHVLKRSPRKGAPGLRVEAWHSNGIVASANALTDQAGAFIIEITKSDAVELRDDHDHDHDHHHDHPHHGHHHGHDHGHHAGHDDDRPRKIFRGIYFKIFRGTTPIPI